MTIETESSGETAGNQAVRQVSGPSRRPSGTSLGVAGRTEINWPQAEANVVSQNLLVSTSRKEISWCNKARLRGASTSRARAKVWAQLPGAGAWAGLGARGHRGLGPALSRGFVVLRGLPTEGAGVSPREAGTGYPPYPPPAPQPPPRFRL